MLPSEPLKLPLAGLEPAPWWPALAIALVVILVIVLVFWLISLRLHDVSIIDSAWSLLQLAAATTYLMLLPQIGARGWLVWLLVSIWALRLAAYISWRNHGQPEDYRYQQIRARNEPNFAWKSVYLVFGLQGLLGWIMSVPIFAAMRAGSALTVVDAIASAFFIAGFLFESIGDWQLAQFKANPANRNAVLNTGLWRFTRHPNYFGEFCMVWALYLFACNAGAAWTLFVPIVMTILLLKVSGVALLEQDIGERRPGYRDYIASTSAFFPWLPRRH